MNISTAPSHKFYDAATFGDMEAVRKMLVTDPALVHSKTKWDFTALHVGC